MFGFQKWNRSFCLEHLLFGKCYQASFIFLNRNNENLLSQNSFIFWRPLCAKIPQCIVASAIDLRKFLHFRPDKVFAVCVCVCVSWNRNSFHSLDYSLPSKISLIAVLIYILWHQIFNNLNEVHVYEIEMHLQYIWCTCKGLIMMCV